MPTSLSITNPNVPLQKNTLKSFNLHNAPNHIKDSSLLFIVCFATFAASYNFIAYNFLAPIIGPSFFASAKLGNEFVLSLQTATVIAVGFLSRPIGALIVGRYGYVKGRKAAMHLAMTVLCLTTLMSTFLPTYATIGNPAPVLLFIVRLSQGLAFGGMVCLGWIYVAESLSRQHLAKHISIVAASIVVGALTAAVLRLSLSYVLSPADMVAYGWRIAFALGTLFAFIGVYLIRNLVETRLFIDYQKKTLTDTKPAFFRFNSMMLTALLGFIFSSVMVLTISLLPKLIAIKFSIADMSMQWAHLAGIASLGIGMFVYGWLGDKIDVGRALMVGSLLLILQTLLLYSYLNNGQGDYLIVMYALLGFFGGVIALCPVIFIQLFPFTYRLMTIGVIFNLMAVLSGAVFRFGLIYATQYIGFAPALYVCFICICAFIVGLFIYQIPDWQKLEPLTEIKHS